MAKSSKRTPLKHGTFQQRLIYWLEPLRWSASQYAGGAGILVFLGILVLLPLRHDSPVIKRERVGAVITSIAGVPVRPLNASGYRYRYTITPNDTNVIALVTDDASHPHSVGAIVQVERRTRQNGAVTYHMVPPNCVTPDCIVLDTHTNSGSILNSRHWT